MHAPSPLHQTLNRPRGLRWAAACVRAAVNVGDKVLLPEYGGTALKLDGEECVTSTLETRRVEAFRRSSSQLRAL
jgi:hypothetical protein